MNAKKITVIYHSADFDGIFCREIAKHFLSEAELIGWNFGDPSIVLPADGRMVYVLDLSPDCLNDFQSDRIIWIDHHKTSIDKWPASIPGYRIDGVAACRLTWQHFECGHLVDAYDKSLPVKEDFLTRKVREPYAVTLAGEYDIWDKHDGNADTLQYALRVIEPDWEKLLGGDRDYLEQQLQAGRIAQVYARNMNASVCNSRTWLMDWEGLKFLCVNAAQFNSMLFASKDVPETGHDALLGFNFNGKQWTFSLYHANHRKELDLSAIAKKYGGGGHRGACGFTRKELPFSL